MESTRLRLKMTLMPSSTRSEPGSPAPALACSIWKGRHRTASSAVRYPNARMEELEGAPFIRLTGDFEEYLATRSRHRRQDIRRTLRRSADRDVVYRVAATTDVEQSLAALERTHRSRWGDRSVFTDSFERFQRVARKGVEIGEVHFHEAVHGDEIVASLVTVDHGDVCAFYQTGRDPQSPFSESSGTLVKARAIERAAQLGIGTVDLCYGDPQAKTEWADDSLRVLAFRWSVGLRGHAVRGLRRTVGSAVRYLRAGRRALREAPSASAGSQ